MSDRINWHTLEMSVRPGTAWRFDDGETCIVDRLTHNGIEPAVICTSGISYPIAALVRTADKIAVAAQRAA